MPATLKAAEGASGGGGEGRRVKQRTDEEKGKDKKLKGVNDKRASSVPTSDGQAALAVLAGDARAWRVPIRHLSLPVRRHGGDEDLGADAQLLGSGEAGRERADARSPPTSGRSRGWSRR